MSAEKKRIDLVMFEKGLTESREKAKRLIMEGNVYIDEQRVDKAGTFVSDDVNIIIREKPKYVSRGGLKLEKSIENFDVSLKDKICMDIGASGLMPHRCFISSPLPPTLWRAFQACLYSSDSSVQSFTEVQFICCLIGLFPANCPLLSTQNGE